MAYEPKVDSGTLFNNDRKEKETHPDMNGDGLVHCPECSRSFAVWLKGWWKSGKRADFLSLSIKAKDDPGAGPRRPSGQGQQSRPAYGQWPKQQQRRAQRPPPQQQPEQNDDQPEDDIPF